MRFNRPFVQQFHWLPLTSHCDYLVYRLTWADIDEKGAEVLGNSLKCYKLQDLE